jgi:hypothetical protein
MKQPMFGAVPGMHRVLCRQISLITFASRQRLKINFGYVARPTTQYVKRTNEALSSDLRAGSLERQAMYVFATEDLRRRAIATMPNYGKSQILDGFFLILTE